AAPAHAPAAIAVAVGRDLGAAWRTREAEIMDRIARMREAHEVDLGVGFPAIRLQDDARLPGLEYEIRLFGARYASMALRPDMQLAIRGGEARGRLDGETATEPAFGMPAVWIDNAQAARAKEEGYTVVDPATVLLTHLGEVLRGEAATLLTRATVSRLLEDVRARQPGLVEELAPSLMTVSDIQRVLQNLVSEGVSIAAIDHIIEHLVDLARTEKDPAQLAEAVRGRIGYAICNRLQGRHRDLAVISLDPRIEHQIQSSIAAHGRREGLGVDPQLAELALRKIAPLAADMLARAREPVLLCSAEIRRSMRALTRRSIPRLSVIAVSEIPNTIELSSFAVVRQDAEETRRIAPAPQPS
ncbi:MAG: flagellar biosynthesis protein FlhA, partial [Alphaproteobacteria bacterium]